MLHLDWLEAFTVFAEHLSFTRAARALHLSQPALHVQIGKLGAELGVPLYVRRGQRLELTQDGRRVLLFAREMGERERAFRDVLRGGESLQPVALAAGEGSFLYLLGPAIRAFTGAARAPLRLLTRDLEATLAAVRSGEAHLGVAPIEGAPADLTIDPLTEVAQVLAVPAAHPLARKRSIKLRDLQGARLIVPPPGRPHRAAITAALLAAGISWEPAVEASGWEPMLHFVALGVGIAVVNACCRLPRGLVARPLPELPRRAYSLIRRRDAALEGATAELRKVVLAHAETWRSRQRATPEVVPLRRGEG
jgi:LysR family transcriptional regulator, low CO2-responsive transcriptional regulator